MPKKAQLRSLNGGGKKMTTISAYKARTRLYQLIQEAADSHLPITIKGERSDAVLVSAADWASIQRTLQHSEPAQRPGELPA
jgi:antitoxin YefM